MHRGHYLIKYIKQNIIIHRSGSVVFSMQKSVELSGISIEKYTPGSI